MTLPIIQISSTKNKYHKNSKRHITLINVSVPTIPTFNNLSGSSRVVQTLHFRLWLLINHNWIERCQVKYRDSDSTAKNHPRFSCKPTDVATHHTVTDGSTSCKLLPRKTTFLFFTPGFRGLLSFCPLSTFTSVIFVSRFSAPFHFMSCYVASGKQILSSSSSSVQ